VSTRNKFPRFAYSGSTLVSVLLSHSSQDKPFVRTLADELETGSEIKVWLDERDIGYGENIVAKIGQGQVSLLSNSRIAPQMPSQVPRRARIPVTHSSQT
jgi:hypothetical protein